ncbi:hypothetical protein VTJ49DRAFT_170 [Mycothermus thermophilus]|uniref:Uncharacterized protein n=1 Tax=Humicola insolens TaxID=85995 RepID=A0ABR3VGK4_HUMIN
MSLSPLQSRLVASLVASCLLLLLYLFLFPPQFALAAELRNPSPVVFDDAEFAAGFAPRAAAAAAAAGPAYDPDFSLFDRSIIGRASDGPTLLTNNEPMAMNIDPGATQNFVFSWQELSGRDAEEGRLELRGNDHHHNVSQERSAGAGATAGRDVAEDHSGEQTLVARQTSRMIWISATTCQQPQPADPSKTMANPPQLTLYISKTPANQSPGPGADRGTQDVVVFEEGGAWYKFTTDDVVYLGVHAPDMTEDSKGGFSFLLAASIDEYYYSYEADAVDDLYLVDSDSQGAILMTKDLMDSPDPVKEQQIMGTQPYALFAHNAADPAINGLKRSYCGLKTYAHMAVTNDGRSSEMIKTVVTKRGKSNIPKQQFFFTGLNASAEYIAILAQDTRGSGDLGKRQVLGQGRGPLVFRETSFRTKSDHGNCALIVDLAFCDQVAYAVPSNPNFGNSTKLAQFYDTYAATMYANFNKSLAQIACEAPPSQRYSLARNCTDCAAAYKDWLCSVTIPRCEDFDTQADYLQPRAVYQPFPDGSTLSPEELSAAKVRNTTLFNASRNPLIDEVIKPGPYKELLPCDDLCYKLVQGCPAAMGFSCPLPGDIGFKGNYGQHDPERGLTCNFPGSAHVRSGAGRAQTPQQRRANLKFAKEVEARMGKSEDQIKKRGKDQPKSPISPFWFGELPIPFPQFVGDGSVRDKRIEANTCARPTPVILGFVVFGGLFFEVLARIFSR